MTDQELADFLDLPVELIPKLGPKRATYERLAQLTDELNLWQAGKGPKPQGVLID